MRHLPDIRKPSKATVVKGRRGAALAADGLMYTAIPLRSQCSETALGASCFGFLKIQSFLRTERDSTRVRGLFTEWNLPSRTTMGKALSLQ